MYRHPQLTLLLLLARSRSRFAALGTYPRCRGTESPHLFYAGKKRRSVLVSRELAPLERTQLRRERDLAGKRRPFLVGSGVREPGALALRRGRLRRKGGGRGRQAKAGRLSLGSVRQEGNDLGLRLFTPRHQTARARLKLRRKQSSEITRRPPQRPPPADQAGVHFDPVLALPHQPLPLLPRLSRPHLLLPLQRQGESDFAVPG